MIDALALAPAQMGDLLFGQMADLEHVQDIFDDLPVFGR